MLDIASLASLSFKYWRILDLPWYVYAQYFKKSSFLKFYVGNNVLGYQEQEQEKILYF